MITRAGRKGVNAEGGSAPGVALAAAGAQSKRASTDRVRGTEKVQRW